MTIVVNNKEYTPNELLIENQNLIWAVIHKFSTIEYNNREDYFQDLAIKFLEKCVTYDSSNVNASKFSTYMTKCLTNDLIYILRNKTNKGGMTMNYELDENELMESLDSDDFENVDFKIDFNNFIKNYKYKTIILLKYQYGYSNEEIAKKYKVTVARISQVLAQFKKDFKEWLD